MLIQLFMLGEISGAHIMVLVMLIICGVWRPLSLSTCFITHIFVYVYEKLHFWLIFFFIFLSEMSLLMLFFFQLLLLGFATTDHLIQIFDFAPVFFQMLFPTQPSHLFFTGLAPALAWTTLVAGLFLCPGTEPRPWQWESRILNCRIELSGSEFKPGSGFHYTEFWPGLGFESVTNPDHIQDCELQFTLSEADYYVKFFVLNLAA